MNTHIGIVINPYAKKVRRNQDEIYNGFASLVGNHGDIRLTSNETELKQALADFREKKYGVLGITGGDGSLHYVLTVLFGEFRDYCPSLLILKGGTMDNVGRSKGIHGNGLAILERYMKKVHAGEPLTTARQTLLHVDGKYSFIFGTGLITKFLRRAYENRKGYFQNMIISLDVVMDFFRQKSDRRYFNKIRGSFYVDGELLPFKKCHAILGATVSSISFGIDPLYRTKSNDDVFQVIILGHSAKWIMNNIFFILAGIAISGKKHFDGTINRLEIISDNPFEYTLDGDIYPCEGHLVVEKGGSVDLVIV